MAGNPYTESGEKFRIPDMLANRADTWNLGDVLEGKEELLALSYIENALTSNPVLSPHSTRPREDLVQLVRLAEGRVSSPEQLQHSYSAPELEEILAVLKKLVRCRDVLSKGSTPSTSPRRRRRTPTAPSPPSSSRAATAT